VIAYPDTSFLFALYRQQDNSRAAATHFTRMPEPLHVTAPLLYEFRQSMRFQVWLHRKQSDRGFPERDCDQALADLQADLRNGALVIVSADAVAVHQEAERLSATYTKSTGHRAFDVLHVATALVLEAKYLLSFDASQRKLARAEGLRVKP